MTNIILCGKKGDTALSNVLLPALAQYGSVQYCSAGSLKAYGTGETRFLVYDSEKIPHTQMESGILLFKNSFQPASAVCLPKGFLCVFESQNSRAAEVLRGTGMTAVTCGMSSWDTLSIASIDYGSAALSLQRSIRTVDGVIIEPCEITVSLTASPSPRQILAVCLTLLLAGVDFADGYLI
jgi:hypothetical protein